MTDLSALTQYAVVAFASLFILVDPLATAPILGHAAQATAFLGQTGLPFLPRLLGVLLAVIAVQFILQGVEETVIRLLHQLR
jgi:small neutral amino acid transporter SnatA (MarC family)